MKKPLLIFMLAAAMVLAASMAYADTVYLAYDTVDHAVGVTLTYTPGSNTFLGGGNLNGTYDAGNYILSISNNSNGIPSTTISGYCISSAGASSSFASYTIVPITTSSPAWEQEIAWIVEQGYNSTPMSAEAQVAVWELAWNAQFGFATNNSGGLPTPPFLYTDPAGYNPDFNTEVNTILTDAYNGATATGFSTDGVVFFEDGGQSYVGSTAPLDCPWLLMATSFLVLNGLRWRRKHI